MAITLQDLNTVRRLAETTRIRRLLHQPVRYLFALVHQNLLYPYTRRPLTRRAKLFYGPGIQVSLPSSTDIYLTGGKSHPSEIRLAAFFIQHVKAGMKVLDIGAHIGYFTLLASELTGAKGAVCAIEPSPATFELLRTNAGSLRNVHLFHQVLSDTEGEIRFYEFPERYSEYNSLDVEQFRQASWFKKHPPREVKIPSLTLDALAEKEGPFDFIKIDVEGAEAKVIAGGSRFLQACNPMIAMEYLSEKRGNESHQKAEAMLRNWGYLPYTINTEGALLPVQHVSKWLQKQGADSDNIVFKKGDNQPA